MEKRITSIKHNEGIVEGYFAKWDSPNFVAEIGQHESFSRGSIDYSRPVVLKSLHDQHSILGSTRSKTLQITEDSKGLKFRCKIPEADKLTRELLSRGDLCDSSMGFVCQEDEVSGNNRNIKKCVLHEISLVPFGAHKTPVNFRSANKPKRKWTDLL